MVNKIKKGDILYMVDGSTKWFEEVDKVEGNVYWYSILKNGGRTPTDREPISFLEGRLKKILSKRIYEILYGK